MKICNTCSEPHDRPKSSRCFKCERKVINTNYCTRNRENLRDRSREYRKKNRELANKRAKRSREENIEYYRQRALERFIAKRGLPSDYKPWKRKSGEGNITASGYKVITLPDHEKGHPNSFDKRRRIHEHTWVMSQHLGRPLHKGETVHHINGNRLDNRLENLELWHRSHPPGQRVEEKIAWAIEFLRAYGYEVAKKA